MIIRDSKRKYWIFVKLLTTKVKQFVDLLMKGLRKCWEFLKTNLKYHLALLLLVIFCNLKKTKKVDWFFFVVIKEIASLQTHGFQLKIFIICLTTHFIGDNWRLQNEILNLCQVTDHKGETICRQIETCLLD